MRLMWRDLMMIFLLLNYSLLLIWSALFSASPLFAVCLFRFTMKGACFFKLSQLTLLLIIHIASLSLAVKDITTDKAALLVLKSHITYDPSYSLANWSTTSPVCSWVGVTCGRRHNRVTALDISEMALNGTIPSEIGNLSFIAFISLSKNHFHGSLPGELTHCFRLKHLDFGFNSFSGSIPPGLESLPKLKSLSLEFNSLEGEFPSSLCNISSLQSINVSTNQLSSFVPSNILLESSLQIIDLSSNKISGGLPKNTFKYLTKLRGLYLNGNQISGSIPGSIANCTWIKEINLGKNYNLTGMIPPQIGDLRNLEVFRIDDNLLSGNIPSTLFNISTMKAIWMQGNHLSGRLPSTVSLPNLLELHLSGNELVGTIPSSISNSTMLTFFDVSDNLFTDFLPEKLGSLRDLQVFSVSNNDLRIGSPTPKSSFLSSLTNHSHLRRIDLSGTQLYTTLPSSFQNLSTCLRYLLANNCNIMGHIPIEIGNLTNLVALDLGNNELNGNIPTTIGRLQNLQGLNFQGNKLLGNITIDLCLLDNLFDLSLGGNILSGTIPECLGNLITLGHLNLSSNKLSSTIPLTFSKLDRILTINMSSNLLRGSVPLEFGQLGVAEEIDLSKNLLSGEIPESLGKLPSLNYLSLAQNVLQGPIPNLSTSLVFLDLSYNNLSGVIPKSLAAYKYLTHFNVSFNGLQGEVPNEGPFAAFPAESYLMNKALCGPARLHLPPCKSEVLQRSLITLGLILLFIALVGASIYIIRLQLRKRKMRLTLSLDLSLDLPEVIRVSYLELEQATDGFSGGNLLGIGSSGSVYKGTLRDGMVVAVKVFNLEKNLSSFAAECEVLRHTSHRNLIRVICICSMVNFKAIVMEYMTNGNLGKWLYTHNYQLDILQRLDIMTDVALAVKYLHYDFTRPIIHCDLKPSNVLLDEDMTVNVSDFSIAKLLAAKEWESANQGHFMGTVGYVAPEVGLYGIISTKADVYSFGIMLMEIFTAKKPTDDMFTGEMPIRRWVMESLPDEVERVMDPCLLQTEEENFVAKKLCMLSLMKLAVWCTVESPDGRTNMEDVVNILNMVKQVFLIRSEFVWKDSVTALEDRSRREEENWMPCFSA